MSDRNPPSPHQLEVSVFGRGYGESILCHLGDGRWIVVDSLRDRDGRVASLRYLSELGIDPASAIKLILVTHWHDDHVQGVSEVYELVPDTLVAMPIAMRSDELTAFKAAARQSGSEALGSGVLELDQMATIREQGNRKKFRPAISNRTLLGYRLEESSHRHPISVQALSPSDGDVEKFLKEVAAAPRPSEGQRAQPFERNDVSVALWISVGPHRILLGADLENSSDPERGWEAVLKLPAPLDGKAAVIKVPHHGSSNGHNTGIWNALLIDKPIAALTSWNRGRKLPTGEDVARIVSHTSEAYIASRVDLKPKPYLKPVEKKLRELASVGLRMRRRPEVAGHIRLRLDLKEQSPKWEVSLFDGAIALADLAA
jgi:beta-lactamase superfamily II metal-dependent hydrolase